MKAKALPTPGQARVSSPADKLYLRISETAQLLGVTPRTIHNWINARILPSIKPTGRTVLIPRAEVETALNRFRVESHS